MKKVVALSFYDPLLEDIFIDSFPGQVNSSAPIGGSGSLTDLSLDQLMAYVGLRIDQRISLNNSVIADEMIREMHAIARKIAFSVIEELIATGLLVSRESPKLPPQATALKAPRRRHRPSSTATTAARAAVQQGLVSDGSAGFPAYYQAAAAPVSAPPQHLVQQAQVANAAIQAATVPSSQGMTQAAPIVSHPQGPPPLFPPHVHAPSGPAQPGSVIVDVNGQYYIVDSQGRIALAQAPPPYTGNPPPAGHTG